MAVRDEETGLTFVEYWLAEAPMPIIAELNRVPLADRRKTTRKTVLSNIPSSTNTPTLGPNPSTSTLDTEVPIPSSANTQPIPLAIKDRMHPDGGKLIRQRDPGGSRAVFSENTRMLFMHITCPQHPTSLALVDRIFSGFATDVQLERQENSASYRTGASALSCHYTYLAGCGGQRGPTCVYDAHALLVGHQTHTVF
ncbi:hypothetical protein RSAG8_08972, partial [Rhizoctonia solani AG-8 WAC10335]